jgi:hypothetical protein
MKKKEEKIDPNWTVIKLTEPIESEFKTHESYYRIFDRHGLMMGRMISGSKSTYRQMHPDNEVYFNANVVIASEGKVWYGDLDLTLDTPKLQEVADVLKEPLYVLYEMDARFENENKEVDFYKSKAKAVITPK